MEEEYKPDIIKVNKGGYRTTVRFLPKDNPLDSNYNIETIVTYHYVSVEELRKEEIRKKRELRVQKLNSLNENKS